MKLEKFKEKNNKKKGIIIFTVCCIFLITIIFLYSSFALFEVKDTFNLIEGNVEEPGDLYFAFYVDNVLTFTMPLKDSGYNFTKATCNNNATLDWDNELWEANVHFASFAETTNSRTKCTLYFDKVVFDPNKASGVDKIIHLAKTSSELAYDGTTDNNLRYIGANPNNYVKFNNELWRIIGVMNNMKTNESDIGESRIKLVRSEVLLKNNFSWDSSASTVNEGLGINDWSDSDAMKLLNPGYESEKIGGSLYWNSTNGNCYTGKNNVNFSRDFTSEGLKDETSKNMIADTIWNLGGSNRNDNVTPAVFYERERGTTVYSGNPTAWKGKIALLYPSDYGYATSGGETIDRATCLQKGLYSFSEGADCVDNNWLKPTNTDIWILTPDSSSNSYGFRLSGSRNVSMSFVYAPSRLIPTLYLKSEVKIVSGDGSIDQPYELSIS